jgi:hypothetical protein
MIEGLSVLTRLTTLSISFDDETHQPRQRGSHLYTPIRVILPALTEFHYGGRSDYLEDFLAQIDTPQLDEVGIKYVKHYIQALQLSRFIERTENLKISPFTRAEATFYHDDSSFELDCPQGNHSFGLNMSDQQHLEVQVRRMAAILGQLALCSNVNDLFAYGELVDSSETDVSDWLPFFRLFPSVESLRLSGAVAATIVSGLENIPEDMVTDVFPALRLIWLVEAEDEDDDSWNEPVGSIAWFLSLRELSGLPVTVVNAKDAFVEAARSLRQHDSKEVLSHQSSVTCQIERSSFSF